MKKCKDCKWFPKPWMKVSLGKCLHPHGYKRPYDCYARKWWKFWAEK